ncbi:hypothetical protein AA313_de0201763 [Arthrobotrys entomopaga]|nr:hypothetical protein AA313_de0201763 [Arthrobotrys entomopaga]
MTEIVPEPSVTVDPPPLVGNAVVIEVTLATLVTVVTGCTMTTEMVPLVASTIVDPALFVGYKVWVVAADPVVITVVLDGTGSLYKQRAPSELPDPSSGVVPTISSETGLKTFTLYKSLVLAPPRYRSPLFFAKVAA